MPPRGTPMFQPGMRCTVDGSKTGEICFVGPTHFSADTWYGVALDEPKGLNDGSVDGTRYFTCKPGFGVFARRFQLTEPHVKGTKRKMVVGTASIITTSDQESLSELSGEEGARADEHPSGSWLGTRGMSDPLSMSLPVSLGESTGRRSPDPDIPSPVKEVTYATKVETHTISAGEESIDLSAPVSEASKATPRKARRLGSRSRSFIDPRDISAAHKLTKESQEKLKAKRARRKTAAVTKADVSAAGVGDSSKSKEAKMLREMMGLQKQHITLLKDELAAARRENDDTVEHAASLEKELGALKLENAKLIEELQAIPEAREAEIMAAERDLALEKLRDMVELVKRMAEHTDIPALKAEVKAAFRTGFTSEETSGQLSRLSRRWDDYDFEVAEQNAQLERSLDLQSESLLMDTGGSISDSEDGLDEVSLQLQTMHQRLSQQLKGIILHSNDTRIRSQSLSPRRRAGDITDLY